MGRETNGEEQRILNDGVYAATRCSLMNVVVLEHTVGHCLKPAVKGKRRCSARYCIRRWGDGGGVGVAVQRRVLSNSHMIVLAARLSPSPLADGGRV